MLQCASVNHIMPLKTRQHWSGEVGHAIGVAVVFIILKFGSIVGSPRFDIHSVLST